MNSEETVKVAKSTHTVLLDAKALTDRALQAEYASLLDVITGQTDGNCFPGINNRQAIIAASTVKQETIRAELNSGLPEIEKPGDIEQVSPTVGVDINIRIQQ